GACLACIGRTNVLLIHDWKNGSRNDVPMFVDCDWDNRLDVYFVLKAAFGRAGIPVHIALDRNTDQGRDRILQLLCKVSRFARCWFASGIPSVTLRSSIFILRQCGSREGEKEYGREEDRQPPHACGHDILLTRTKATVEVALAIVYFLDYCAYPF